jgi:peptidoglycan/LPS O-acetylase OafA/YrhL
MSGHSDIPAPSFADNRPRLKNIQALRGLAAVLVMLSHLFIIEQKYSQDHILPDVLNFGMFGVDIFFVISGFIMVYVTHKWADGAIRHIPNFIFSRAARIYPLYWLVSLPLLGLYLLRPELIFSSSVWNEPNLLKSFFLWPDTAFPLLEIGWTLIHEMSFYLIFALILIAPRRLRPLLIGMWSLLVIIAFNLGAAELGPVSRILSHPLTLEFSFGALLAYGLMNQTPEDKARGGVWLLTLSGVIFCLAVAAFKLSGHNHPGMGWPRTASLGISALILLIAVYILEDNGKTAPQWSVTLGDWSYALYLTHILSLSLFGRIWALCDQPGLWDNFIILPLILMTAIVIAGAVHKIIEAPLMRASKKLQKRRA